MRIFAGVYWSARREDVSQCAMRAEKHFAMLADVSENLSQWYRGGRRKPAADMCVDARSPQVLGMLLNEGVNRKDVGAEIMHELGFGLSLWNRDSGGWSVGTTVKCGLYSQNKNLSNVANLSIEVEENKAPNSATMVGVLERLIEIWEPESGRVEQNFMPPYEGDEVPRGEDILYASYWVSRAGEKGRGGAVERFGRGWLWRSAELAWRAPSA